MTSIPEIMIEVVSPSSTVRDYVKKTAVYQETGAKEYWIVNPDKHKVLQYFFDSPYFLETGQPLVWEKEEDAIYCEVLPDFSMTLKEIFEL